MPCRTGITIGRGTNHNSSVPATESAGRHDLRVCDPVLYVAVSYRRRAEPVARCRPKEERQRSAFFCFESGCIFFAEMPFLRRIDRWRSVAEVENLDALVDLGQRLPDANKHGSTG